MERNVYDDLCHYALMLTSEIYMTKNPGKKIKRRAEDCLNAIRAVQATWKR